MALLYIHCKNVDKYSNIALHCSEEKKSGQNTALNIIQQEYGVEGKGLVGDAVIKGKLYIMLTIWLEPRGSEL